MSDLKKLAKAVLDGFMYDDNDDCCRHCGKHVDFRKYQAGLYMREEHKENCPVVLALRSLE